MLFLFRLFIAGDNPRSRNAIRSARALCGQLPEGRWRLDVVDVLESARQAEADGVLATPTLLCMAPHRALRVVGALPADGLILRLLPTSTKLM